MTKQISSNTATLPPDTKQVGTQNAPTCLSYHLMSSPSEEFISIFVPQRSAHLSCGYSR